METGKGQIEHTEQKMKTELCEDSLSSLPVFEGLISLACQPPHTQQRREPSVRKTLCDASVHFVGVRQDGACTVALPQLCPSCAPDLGDSPSGG